MDICRHLALAFSGMEELFFPTTDNRTFLPKRFTVVFIKDKCSNLFLMVHNTLNTYCLSVKFVKRHLLPFSGVVGPRFD